MDTETGFSGRYAAKGLALAVLTAVVCLVPVGSAWAQDAASYEGRSVDAAWRAEARERIQRYRMADISVHVVDERGRPVPDAAVAVEMQRHAFRFGSAVTARMLNKQGPDGRRYRHIVKERFNRAVFENDLKWMPWQTGQTNRDDRYRREWVAAALDSLAAWDIDVRGHYVLWGPLEGGSTPDDLTGDDVEDRRQPEKLRRAWLDNIRHRVAAAEQLGRLAEWDGINHPVGWGPPTVLEVLGTAFYADVLREAAKLAPEAEIWINEGNILSGDWADEYAEVIRALKELGSSPDGIGFMGHFDENSLRAPAALYDQMDRFADLAPHLQLTELDVDVPDDRLQADYLRDVMTVAFSHPAVEGIVLWGFWAGRHWKPEAALYNRDWSREPSADVWDELVFEQWWTDRDGRTNGRGRFGLRGFLGTYHITAEKDGRRVMREVTLPDDGTTVELVLPIRSM